MKIEKTESKRNTQELLPQIVERIFAICRSDPNFRLKDELEIIENKMQALKQKIEKQNDLLEQSSLLKNDLLQRLKSLESQNESKQMYMIESIGGEL